MVQIIMGLKGSGKTKKLVDMVRAIAEGRPGRASGDMALHSLEVGEAILVAAREERFVSIHTTFERPEPMPEKVTN